MSDLISRKKVIDILEKEKSLRCGYDADIAVFSIEKGIRELPTAYSVGKVVEELPDDVCEWKTEHIVVGMRRHMPNCCDKGLDMPVSTASGLKYCPYCGKKIKVVE